MMIVMIVRERSAVLVPHEQTNKNFDVLAFGEIYVGIEMAFIMIW
jgi:hypothetical protein